jgi:putative oxidoreductase
MMSHGYQKISDFNGTAAHMPHLFGFSGAVNASLVIFAEFFCALFVILGLFTRLACVPIIVTMFVALYMVHHLHFFSDGEAAAIYLMGFITLLIIGPGKVSVDGMIGK